MLLQAAVLGAGYKSTPVIEYTCETLRIRKSANSLGLNVESARTFNTMIFQALIAFALAFGTLLPLQAQTASGGATAPGDTGAPQPPAVATGSDAAKDLPSDAALLREHLAEGERAPPGQGNPLQSLQRPRTGPEANSSQFNSAPRPAQGAREEGSVANAVKDFVKPLHQEISNSSVVQVVREIDAAVSGTSQADRAQEQPGYAPRGTQAAGTAPGTAPGSRGVDPQAVALMWQEFLEEVVPWALAGAVVAMLGYGGFFWLKVIKFKNAKQGNKRREARKSVRRLSRTFSRTFSTSSPSAAGIESAQDEIASPEPVARSRRSSLGGSDRSSRRGSSSEPGRASSKGSNPSPSRSSDRSSDHSLNHSSNRSANHKPGGAIR